MTPKGEVRPITLSRIGKKFGKLTVSSAYSSGGITYGLCKCECGSEKALRLHNVFNGKVRSCGCLQAEMRADRAMNGSTSGHCVRGKPSRTYRIWKCMRNRCNFPGAFGYEHYGARGIKVCERWDCVGGFSAFLADMGECPTEMSIDRIDVNGNYEPGNCRWATNFEQARNRRDNKIVVINGTSKCITDWIAEYGISYNGMKRRLKSGWTIEDAITVPPNKKRCNTGSEGVSL